MIATPPQRLFFALWPPPEIAAALHGIAADVARDGGRPMRQETLHLTLDFVGRVPADKFPAIEAAGSAVRATAFTLLLDRLDYLSRKNIVWAGCNNMPPGLAELASQLKTRLRECWEPASETPFVAHITLLRNVLHPPELPSMRELKWLVGDFRLMHSELRSDGVRYTEIRRWPLGR